MNNLNAFITEQSLYNLMNRKMRPNLSRLPRNMASALSPGGPLAGGFLTGKYRKGEKYPANFRLASGIAIYGNFFNDECFNKLTKLEKFAGERGHRVGELAIAWLLSKPYVSTIIAGARQAEQLTEHVVAGQWKLTAQEAAEVDAIGAE